MLILLEVLGNTADNIVLFPLKAIIMILKFESKYTMGSV